LKLKVTADGKPISNAVISVSSTWAAKTNADGTVDLPKLASAGAGIIVAHPDYAPTSTSFNSSTNEVKLTRGVIVRGRVVAPDGRTAVPKAQIAIGNWLSAETADDGSFTIAHAPTGWSWLRATTSDGAAIVSNSGAASYTLRLGPPASISGSVRDTKTRAAVAGTFVWLGIRNEGAPIDATAADAKGIFTFNGVPPLQYTITALHPAYQIDVAPIDANDHAPHVLSAIPLARVRGIVIDEEKKPVRGAIVAHGALPQFSAGRSAVTNARGEFALRLPANRQTMTAEDELHAAKEGYAGGTAAAKIASGDTTTGITITLVRGIPLTMRVVDRNQQPISGASISLTPWRNDPFALRISPPTSNNRTTDTDGQL